MSVRPPDGPASSSLGELKCDTELPIESLDERQSTE